MQKGNGNPKWKDVVTGLVPAITCLLLLGVAYLVLAIPANMKIPAMVILYFLVTLIIAFLSLFRQWGKFPLYWLPAIFVFYFIRDDALWASELIWDKNYAFFSVLEALVALIFGGAVIRGTGYSLPRFKKEVFQGADPLYQKLAIIPVVVLAGYFTWSMVHQIICTAIYHLPGKNVQRTARVYGTGSIRGKYYYHRYWKIELDNGIKEKFWIYATAKTEDGSQCSTTSDPGIGSTLYLTGKQTLAGFSYETLDKIIAENGKMICP